MGRASGLFLLFQVLSRSGLLSLTTASAATAAIFIGWSLASAVAPFLRSAQFA
jgi:hypothetical protein